MAPPPRGVISPIYPPRSGANGDNAPAAAFGPSRAATPGAFWARPRIWPNVSHQPPGIAPSPMMLYGPVRFAKIVVMLCRTVSQPALADVAVAVVARLCKVLGSRLINWDSCAVMSELAAAPAAWATTAD